MRYIGPIYHKMSRVSRDKYELIGRTILGQLKSRMAKFQQQQGRITRTLLDGTEITCWVLQKAAGIYPVHIIRIRNSAADRAGDGFIIEGIGTFCESGLIAVEAFQGVAGGPPTINEEFPFQVYTDSGVEAYLTGSGTTIPGVIPTAIEYLVQQEVDIDGNLLSRVCPVDSTKGLADFPDTFSLDAKNSYTSLIYTKFARALQLFGYFVWSLSKSSKYTGLMRFAVQAKNGVIGGVQSLGNINPNSTGLFRRSDYRYWMINTSEGGCTAQLMDTEQECVRQWLAAGTVSGVFWEALVLSGLTPADLAPAELLTAEDLEDVYDGRSPLAYGWHYSRGEVTQEASIVTIRQKPGYETNYRDTTLARIDFTIPASGNPSAVLDLEEVDQDFEPDPEYDSIYYPGLNYLTWLLPSHTLNRIPKGNNVAIYCWYMADETRQVVRYTAPSNQSGYSNPPPSQSNCGCGSYAKNFIDYASNDWVQAGFSFDATPTVDNKYGATNVSGGSTESLEINAALTGSSALGDSGMSHNSIATRDINACDGRDPYPSSFSDGTIYNWIGEATGEKIYSVTYDPKNKHVLIIPFDDSETCYFSTITSNSKVTTETSTPLNPPKAAYKYTCKQRVVIPSGGYDDTWNVDVWLHGGTETDSYTSQGYRVVNKIYWTTAADTDYTGKFSRSYLITSGDPIRLDDSDPTVWELYNQVSIPFPELSYGMYTTVSYQNGDKQYWRQPQDQKTLEPEYGFTEEDDLDWKQLRWLGGA